MRGLKSTIALLVVLIGLGAYIYFVTWKQTDGDSASPQARVFTSLNPDQIEEVTIKAESGDVTTLKKTGETWDIVAPVDADVSANDVQGVTSALGSLELERIVEENPTDLKQYGLDPPRFEVEFKADGGAKSGHIIFGSKSPTGGSMYARRNDEKQVILVPEFQNGSLNKTTFELRNKALMTVDRDNLDGIELNAFNLPGHPLDLTKTGNDWTMTRPIKVRADAVAVRNLVDRISTTQMKSIATDQPTSADLKQFGLENPAATITFRVAKERFTLALGSTESDATIYARDMSRPFVMTVDKETADDVRKTVDDFRRKEVFDFNPSNVTRAEFTRGSQTIAFEKIKGQGDEYKWRRISPSPADADKDKVDSLMSAVVAISATSFVASTANTGLNSPAMTVLIKSDDATKEEHVSFGKSGDSIYALVPGQPGAAKIDAARFTDVGQTLDELAK